MHERRPSQTASAVALWRALAHEGLTSVRGFSDPVAHTLLSPGWQRAFRVARRWSERAPAADRAKFSAHTDIITLRVLAIDAELERAVSAGCRQLVVLGAGLDTRAWRVPQLADVDVFEVDHPATQAYKKRRTEAMPHLARSLAFVEVDFERDDLVARLAAAGHRPDVPTVWIWEGVVMYLSRPALRGSLAAIVRASAPGSVLLMNYHEPYAEQVGKPEPRIRRLVLSLVREPMIGLLPAADMQAEVARAGLVVEHDANAAEWVARFGAAPLAGGTARVARLLRARKA